MKIKFFIVTVAATLLAGGSVFAQKDSQQEEIDALKRKIAELSEIVTDTKKDTRLEQVWQKRARYFNLGYVNQFRDLSGYGLTTTDNPTVKSSLGASLSWGKQFYLHKKPIGKVLKFAIDWSWIDVNYAQYQIEGVKITDDIASKELKKYNQVDLAMQFGASLSINPVDHLKISGYFRVSPTYSILMNQKEATGYVTHLNAGVSLAYKVASFGYEYRWGTLSSNVSTTTDAATTVEKNASKITSSRIYFGFRF